MPRSPRVTRSLCHWRTRPEATRAGLRWPAAAIRTVARLERSIELVSIAKQGSRTPAETEREHDPFFRHAQAFRAGIEGTISFLKRVLCLARCLNKGWEHFVATIGETIFVHNLLVLARC